MKVVVTKRFEVWLEKEMDCHSLDDALAIAKEMKICDFGIPRKGSILVDSTELKGTGVREDW